jgi:outer membrane lipoprotein-sorting protein
MLAIAVSGCGYEMETYGPMSTTEARGILRQRAESIHTVSSEASLFLARANGQNVQLEAALVIQPPDSMHLRAWKFDQAVFDLTMTRDGVWLMQPPPQDSSRTAVMAPATTDPFDQPGVGRGLTATWRLLSGDMFSGEPFQTDQAIDNGSYFDFRRVQSDGMLVVCQVDKRTITPKRYQLFDAGGAERFELSLDNYVNNGYTVWPFKIVARQFNADSTGAPADTIEIDFQHVDLNAPLADGAFVPPRRARKLP